MQHYTHIVLGIPHANGQAYSSPEKRWRGDKAIVSERNRWTDWYTHELFGRIRDNVFVVQSEGSRFDCDLERLEHEPDRICRYYYKEKGGVAPSVAFQNEMLAKWFGYRAELMAAAAKGERAIILDCHSFPSDYEPMVDVCLGYNEDGSRPAEAELRRVMELFERNGYRTAFNRPYGNAIAPIGYIGKSLMIEVSKRCYMDESKLRKGSGFASFAATIDRVYDYLLGVLSN